jgi:hypothetical protein
MRLVNPKASMFWRFWKFLTQAVCVRELLAYGTTRRSGASRAFRPNSAMRLSPKGNLKDHLLRALGLALSPPVNENKILVGAPITAYAFTQTGLRKSGPCGAV